MENSDGRNKIYTPDELSKTFKLVTSAKFTKFLKSRGIDVYECRACGERNTALNVVNSTDCEDTEMYMAPIKTIMIGMPDGVELLTGYNYRIMCNNCGFESLYNAYPVVSWIIKGGDTDE